MEDSKRRNSGEDSEPTPQEAAEHTKQSPQQLYGRSISEVQIQVPTYKLPVDNQEGEVILLARVQELSRLQDVVAVRLSHQHVIWRILMGGLYPADQAALVRETLSRTQDGQAAILDLGSGSGIWAVEMALEFPNASVIGLDLAPHIPKEVPPNCSLQTGDIRRDLEQFQAKFDLVHCRSVAGHISDFGLFLPKIADCLRPGGLLILAGGDMGLFGTAHEDIEPALASDTVLGAAAQNRSWFARLLQEVTQRLQADARGVGRLATTGKELGSLFRADARFDPETIGRKKYYAPVGWAGTDSEYGKELGELMKRNCLQYARAWGPYLSSKGVPSDQIDEWMKNAEEELDGPTLKMYAGWHVAWGFKP